MDTTRHYVANDAFAMKWLDSAALHPDGSRLVYAVRECNAETDHDSTSVWERDVASGGDRRLTFASGTSSRPAWSPDGETLAFVCDGADGTPQIFVATESLDEARQLTAFANGIDGAPVWSPDGTCIATTARQQHSPPEDPTKPHRVTRNVYRFDGLGYVHRMVNDIYCVAFDPNGDVPVDAEHAVRLTDNEAINASLAWSPDGTALLFTRRLDPETLLGVRPDIASVDMAGNETTIISNTEFAVSAATWHPDGERIVFAATPRSKPNGCKADLYVSDPLRGERANRTTMLPMGVCGILQGDMPSPMDLQGSKIVVEPDGAAAWCDVQRGGSSEIVRVALDGPESVHMIVGGERNVRLLDVASDLGKVLFSASDIHRPIDLYLCDSDGGSERAITNVNSTVLSRLNQPTVRHLRFTSVDGVEVEAWHIAPDASDVAWPTVLSIHGGPHLGFGNIYRLETHMLNGAGIAVLLVNQRASSGYDDDFGTINGDWGNLDYQDLMFAVDYAIAQGLTDADRLGVCGLSGGGYLSCWIVGQTDRFCAAVPENPITNWVSSYGVGDASVWLAVEELGGHPHEIPDVYARCSPITYAHRCTTPTLLIQGESDWRCTAEQSEQFYTYLKVNGCDAEMLRLPESSHLGSIVGPPSVRRAKNEAMLDWFSRHLFGSGGGDPAP